MSFSFSYSIQFPQTHHFFPPPHPHIVPKGPNWARVLRQPSPWPSQLFAVQNRCFCCPGSCNHSSLLWLCCRHVILYFFCKLFFLTIIARQMHISVFTIHMFLRRLVSGWHIPSLLDKERSCRGTIVFGKNVS